MSQAKDINHIVNDVLEVGLSLFKCDRIWIFYPCDPDASSFSVLAEKNRPEYPGAFAAGQEIPVTEEAAESIRKAITAKVPIVFDPESVNSLDDIAKQFSVQSQMIMAVQPRLGKPWMFGLHQCSHPRVWTKNEQMLFQEISFWIVESLNNIILLHDLKESEEQLRVNEKILNKAQEIAHIGSWHLDNQKNVLTWSDETYRIFGLTPQEFGATYEAFLKTVHPDDRDMVNEAYLQAVSNNTSYECTHRIVRPDGTERIVYEKSENIVNESGTVIHSIGMVHDITEQKKAEEDKKNLEQQIQLNRKLESLGILAGGIAHDFNNMLTAIMGNASLAMIEIGTDNKGYDKINEIEKACEKAKGLTQQLLTFSKGGLPVRRATSIIDLIEETANFMLRGSKISCSISHEEDIWPVDIDKGQISQVIQNLVINAVHSMPEGGDFNIRVENFVVDDSTSLPLQPGNYVKLRITDQGKGIPEEDITKIFDPYYSTKSNGTGLGLTVVHSIIRNHKGHIMVESRIGLGTTFIIYLPASQDKIESEKSSERTGLPGSGRILVMDDDATILKVIASMLDVLGFEVTPANDGQKAIDLYLDSLKFGKPFTAVILDLTVPGGIGGQETIKQLLKHDPNVRAFVSSGYADGSVMANFHDYGFIGAIPKPYRMQDLNIIIETLSREES